MSPGPSGGSGWRPTRALHRAILLTGLLVITGVVAGRMDVVLLAAPFALGTAWALRRQPRAEPVTQVSAPDSALPEGAGLTATITAANAGPVAYDVVVLHTRVSPWLELPEALQPQVVRVPAGQAADLVVKGHAPRWGRHTLGPAHATALACDGLLVSRSAPCAPAEVRVHPVAGRFEAAEAMPRAAGLVGAHRSRRSGRGGELAGVRPFAPGDRLRRIDWRVSLRARQLHVAATLSDRDAELVLVLDVLADAGESGGLHGAESVLDTTVRASAAIAEHYLHRGDRVSLVEYGRQARRLRPASGRRQYLTVREWLLDTTTADGAEDPDAQLFHPQVLPANALVVVLTPLIHPGTAPVLARLARAGRFVVAVDTLPASAVAGSDAAYRLWRLERDNVVGALREHGVPVVAWAGPGSLDRVLQGMSRAATAPRMGVR